MTPLHADPNQQEVIAFLGDRRTHGGEMVERIGTHAAMVFLAGDRALKLKRALRYPYLDYSTVEKRRSACAAELAVNRRTAPGLYRGLAAVRRGADGALALDFGTDGNGDGNGNDVHGEPVDWLVVMTRFPADALLDRMAGGGALTPALARRLAERIAGFHARAAARPDGGGAAAMRTVADGNIGELRASPALFPPATVGRLARLTAAALDRHGPLLEERRRAGFVRHGHGDLHLRNIVLLDGEPTLFDAIEFDEALAVADVFYDLAFLLMDLESRGLRRLANVVLNRYLEETDDHGGLAVLPLFLSMRAAVRAKVLAAALVLDAGAKRDPGQGDAVKTAGAQEEARQEARRYLDLALAVLEPEPARLVAVGGLSGAGKTRLAEGMAPGLGPAPGAVVLRSDVLRKRLCGVADTDRLEEGGYSRAVTERVYDGLCRRAAVVLAAGQAAVVDAVSARPEERAGIAAVALAAGVRFDGFWLEAPLPARVTRVTDRRNDASDATADVAQRQETYDVGTIDWMRLDAGKAAADVLGDALAGLDRIQGRAARNRLA
ncbi:bifunctional aminoglycoside phosphotransferase/ATP-binding protein [Azospirillum picis]|uniref:Aminoglycoside phosphotransferase family enzyme/predicted kinase n=1 Tax=Azospirillum picis TaxID=488438 RepID=A0ABU0MUC4_9PROT|nr:AAA family ATPase [Azospirillum picis]MBP2303274.1 aminoglycoside phosphotransferase family enzyme/predicted kinase [Azospirillum picis]MDQ0537102.1 aminoglycoside phosphotransferase family enzyme/predicted kinase [Azospirillum picis]